MPDSDEQIKQYLLYAYEVINAHQAFLEEMQRKTEAIENFLRLSGGRFQEFYPRELDRIAQRNKHVAAESQQQGLVKAADLIDVMWKGLKNL